MKKIFQFLFLTLLITLTCVKVEGTNVGGNTQADSFTESGSAGTNPGTSGFQWDPGYGIRVSLITVGRNRITTQKKCDFYSSDMDLSKHKTISRCGRLESKTCTNPTSQDKKNLGDYGIGDFLYYDPQNNSNQNINNLLKDSLITPIENNQYSNLKQILIDMGVDCLNTNSCDNNSYVTIEPMAAVGCTNCKSYIRGTAYELSNYSKNGVSAVSNWLIPLWRRFGLLKADTTISDLLFEKKIESDSSEKYSEAIKAVEKGKYSNRGIMIYSLADITGGDQGKLKIIKKNSNNDVLAVLDKDTEVRFKLYADAGCSQNPIKDFKADEIVSLSPGTYYLKEYQAKKGYHLPQGNDKWTCEPITVNKGPNATEIEVTNPTECEYKFNSSMTMKERIALYNEIESKYSQDFNGLLNMNNTTAKDACKNIPRNNGYDVSCLAASTSSLNLDFSIDNISMFTEREGNTFCLATYNLKNKVIGENSIGTNDFGTVKSGQLILKQKDAVADGELRRICYNYDSGADFKNNNLVQSFSYEGYVKENSEKLGGVVLTKELDSIQITDNDATSITQTVTSRYYLPYVYLSLGSGKNYYNSCPNGKVCTRTQGILSKFNDKEGPNELDFYITLIPEKFGGKSSLESCKYSVKRELIVPDDPNGEPTNIRLEFRTIETNSKKAFLNKFGTEQRAPGYNWSDKGIGEQIKTEYKALDDSYTFSDLEYENQARLEREKILDKNNNSYNRTGKGAKYTFVLTQNDISKIKKYNKETSYDDYTLDCDENGYNCTSKFLTGLKNGTLLLTTSKAVHSWVMQNKLIVKEDAS